MHRRTAMTLIIIGLAASGTFATAADTKFPLKAGAATADITPEKWPVELIGSFSRRLAGHAWDRLNARALVLDNGETRLAFVTVDSCLVPRTLFDEANRRAAKLCGMPADYILTAATHTHSAPRVKGGRNVEAPADYVEQMTRGIVSALQALASIVHCEQPLAELKSKMRKLPQSMINVKLGNEFDLTSNDSVKTAVFFRMVVL